MIHYLLEGDESPRVGTAERIDRGGSVHSIRQVPSGELLEPGSEVRVLAVDPHEVGRLRDSNLRFIGGLPEPRVGDSSRWVAEQLRRER